MIKQLIQVKNQRIENLEEYRILLAGVIDDNTALLKDISFQMKLMYEQFKHLPNIEEDLQVEAYNENLAREQFANINRRIESNNAITNSIKDK